MDEEPLAAVIRGAQRGDSASFDRLVEAYAGRIFGFLYRQTGSRHDAEDLMQEVFVRIVRMIGGYDHCGRFEAWIFRIAANLARDRLRRKKRAPRQFSAATYGDVDGEGERRPDPLEAWVAVDAVADAGLVLDEEIDALNAALAMLPVAEREVIMLRHFSQMSFKEIAEATGMPLGSALARSHRGLRRLREMMSEQQGPTVPQESARPSARGSGR